MNKKLFYIFLLLLFFNSCFLGKKVTITEIPENDTSEIILLEEIEIKPVVEELKIYKPAKPIINELIHTKLDLSFDWKNEYVYGEATITLSPYIDKTNLLTLDAKYFDIERVAIIKNDDTLNLDYVYDNMEIVITLDTTYFYDENYNIFIKYTAKPNEIPNTGNFVYKDTKGIYFINPKKKDEDKSQQIWTQGETEYSSCWFPTIDSPNQRCTGEIYLTVDAKYVTLSNGELYNTLLNKDTTRTDYWKMDLPIAPYLFMIAVGEFEIADDEWRQIEVDYYYPEGYEFEAKDIFGKTPEMLDFFSNKFDYDYPWNKYSQIVVEDFVSGAMENTTATVFGDFMLKNSWWYSQLDKELVIAHELSHHWFGDLITCDSWANIALNESFATYCEYLWLEFEYGKEDADYHLYSEENYYKYNTKEPIINYYYENKDDMFNGLVYQKGAKILHTLRNYLGDEIFFNTVTSYLNKYEYKSVNINDLQHEFEEISGENLDWFFTQWFLESGYPSIEIKHEKNDSSKLYQLTLKQYDMSGNNKVYFLPMDIALYYQDSIVYQRITFDNSEQIFTFESENIPEFVEIDPNHTIICERNEEIAKEQNKLLLEKSRNGITKYQAITNLSYQITNETELRECYINALDNESWFVRDFILDNYEFEDWKNDTIFIEKLKYLSANDEKEEIRNYADIILLRLN